jgi:putative acetyltransferase
MTGDPATAVAVRSGRPPDAADVAALFRRSRAAAMPWLPFLHTPAQDLAFFGEQVSSAGGLVATQADVAGGEPDGAGVVGTGVIVGFAVANDGWLNHLYVEPTLRGRGIGSVLLGMAKDLNPEGLRLWAFERNVAALRFYAERGFAEVERTDGSGNEEQEPDVLMSWPGQSRISLRTA